MLKVVSMWKLPDGMSEQSFEDWYRSKHIGDAKRIPGLRRYTVNRVAESERANAPYYRMAELSFDSLAAAKAAFDSPEWKHAFADAKDKLAAPIRLFLESEEVPL